jgi:hypothetical protein
VSGLRGMLLACVAMVLLAPVVIAGSVAALFAEEEARAGCTGAIETPSGGTLGGGLNSAPLLLKPGRWYEVGATDYGGPSDPSSGDYGSIPTPGESYLPAHPNSYAELSTLSRNPGGELTFNEADALGRLPYLTNLRVRTHAGELVLAKRDIGYGQGPSQRIGNGEPYRLDVWWQAAQPLQITKSPVEIQLAPESGTAPTLGDTTEPLPPSGGTAECSGETGGAIPLPLTPGTQTRILPSGLAAAGEEAPAAVKAMVAAGNRLYGSAYIYGAAHGTPLSRLEPAYDCSSAVSYVLHAGGVFGLYADDSTGLESYGEPGPGRYITIYTNAGHAFVYIAGLRFDTVEAPEYDSGPNSGKPGARWRVSSSVPGWSTWVVRHPPRL